MLCPTCGRANVDYAAFCAYCQTRLLPEQLRLTEFPVWALLLLHYFTLGIFSMVWINLYHGKLPRRRPNDPTAGRAVGFLFIPFYGLYWVFFTHLRLCERVDQERTRCGLPEEKLRPFAIATCIVQVIPYVGLLSFFLLYPILAGVVQANINEVAAGGTWRCATCGADNPGRNTFCASCGARLPEATSVVMPPPADQVSLQFTGTGLQYLGWGLLAAVGSYTIIPAGWTATAMWRWFVTSLRLSDRRTATFSGTGSQVWGYCSAAAVLGMTTWLAYLSDNPDTVLLLTYAMLVPVTMGQVALGLVILRRWLAHTQVSGGQPLQFTGSYWPLLGWNLLCAVSIYSIVGWAWAGAAALRWFCSNVRTDRAVLQFRGRAATLLWRGVLCYLMCIPIVTAPWAAVWLWRWLAESTVVLSRAEAAFPAGASVAPIPSGGIVCPRCGQRNPEIADYCARCGASLRALTQ